MYYSTTFPTANRNTLQDIFFPGSDLNSGHLPASYQIHVPFQLMFLTMRPEADEHSYILSCISPSGGLYSALTGMEIRELLSVTSLHRHDFYELMLVLDGEIYVNIEHQRHRYTKGCCCILNRNVRHAEEYSTHFRIVFLQLSTELLHSLFTDLSLQLFDIEKESPSDLMSFLHSNLSSDSNSGRDYLDFIPKADNIYLTDRIHALFDCITGETLSPEAGSSVTILKCFLDLFRFLSAPDKFSTTPVRIGSDTEYTLYLAIVQCMTERHGRISRSELSARLHYSGAYLNQIVRKYSHLTIFELGMTFCMKEAARRLKDTRDNITDISTQLGFSNHTHFYRLFREAYGMTPAQYRRRHASQ